MGWRRGEERLFQNTSPPTHSFNLKRTRFCSDNEHFPWEEWFALWFPNKKYTCVDSKLLLSRVPRYGLMCVDLRLLLFFWGTGHSLADWNTPESLTRKNLGLGLESKKLRFETLHCFASYFSHPRKYFQGNWRYLWSACFLPSIAQLVYVLYSFFLKSCFRSK